MVVVECTVNCSVDGIGPPLVGSFGGSGCIRNVGEVATFEVLLHPRERRIDIHGEFAIVIAHGEHVAVAGKERHAVGKYRLSV